MEEAEPKDQAVEALEAQVPNTITGSNVTYATGGAGSPTSTNTGSNGAANRGIGGNGSKAAAGGNGGSGVVVIKESATTFVTAPGVWSINDVYDNVKAGTWSN